MNGQLCPQVEHALQTGAGQAVMRASNRSGAWRYVGMGATCVGLDLDHVLERAARLAPESDLYDLDYLATRLEAGALKGMAEVAPKPKAENNKCEQLDVDAIIDGVTKQ